MTHRRVPRRPLDLATVQRPLTVSEVAELFGVDPKTVTRWARTTDPATGTPRLPSIRTPGGHHRFPPDAIRAALEPTS